MKSYDVNYQGQSFTVEALDEAEAIAKVRATQAVDPRINPVVTESVVEAAKVEAAEAAEPEGAEPEGEGEKTEGTEGTGEV